MSVNSAGLLGFASNASWQTQYPSLPEIRGPEPSEICAENSSSSKPFQQACRSTNRNVLRPTLQEGERGKCVLLLTVLTLMWQIRGFSPDTIAADTDTSVAGTSQDRPVKPSGARGEQPAPSFLFLYINFKAIAPHCSGNCFAALKKIKKSIWK